MKVAISIPDPVFEEAERVRTRLGESRSRLYSRAIEAYIAGHRRDDVRAALDALYADEPSGMDPVLAELQAEALREEW